MSHNIKCYKYPHFKKITNFWALIFRNVFYNFKRIGEKPWLVWLSGLRAGLQTKGSSIPTKGTCLGCRPGPQYRVLERQPHIDVSLPLFLPLFPSLKINK